MRQHRQIAVRSRDRNNPVLVAPDDKSRHLHASQKMRQGLAVHVGLPGDAEAHLARDIPRLELISRRLGAIDAVERLLIMEAGARIVDVTNDSLVKNISLGGLDSHRGNENELRDVK